ncbi:MAG: Uma2 family endonuclease [Cytophagaceae bacterium]|nr:Uma2 family endonuclease [Cytophagaceae bacterium]
METVVEQTDYELERGKPIPSKNHGKLQARLSQTLLNGYEHQYDVQSETSLRLSTGDVVPDLSIFPPEESDWLDDEVRVSKAPLGVIEILSVTQGIQELIDKLDVYFEAGVQSCWIVLPTFRTIHVFYAKHEYKTFTEGILRDEKLDIQVDLGVIFR